MTTVGEDYVRPLTELIGGFITAYLLIREAAQTRTSSLRALYAWGAWKIRPTADVAQLRHSSPGPHGPLARPSPERVHQGARRLVRRFSSTAKCMVALVGGQPVRVVKEDLRLSGTCLLGSRVRVADARVTVWRSARSGASCDAGPQC